MNFDNNDLGDRNEEHESEFDISDFDDFGKDLDVAAKQSLPSGVGQPTPQPMDPRTS